MKTKIYISVILLILILNIAAKSYPVEDHKEKNQKNGLIDLAPYNNAPDNLPSEKDEVQLEGPDLELKYFEDWHGDMLMRYNSKCSKN